MMEMNDMTSKNQSRTSRIFWVAFVTCLVLFPLLLGAQTQTTTQKTFATPQEAADALINAASNYDLSALLQIVGPDGEDLVQTKDPVQDKNQAEAFAALAKQKNSISIDPKNKNRAILVVGENDWPSPIPLVKKNGKWLFDSKAGRTEVLYRRIGTNELDAILVNDEALHAVDTVFGGNCQKGKAADHGSLNDVVEFTEFCGWSLSFEDFEVVAVIGRALVG